VTDDRDDSLLLAALRVALLERQAVPPEFVAAGKSAFAWRDIEAQFAQLTYDSSRDSELAGSVRSETASIRALVFTSAHLSIELEVTDDCLLGQIIPSREGTIETQAQAGGSVVAPIDATGCFSIEPLPAGAFRLRCQTPDGADVVTGWVTL
jgi:hypothetical protein